VVRWIALTRSVARCTPPPCLSGYLLGARTEWYKPRAVCDLWAREDALIQQPPGESQERLDVVEVGHQTQRDANRAAVLPVNAQAEVIQG
jgi:hypothetical protein